MKCDLSKIEGIDFAELADAFNIPHNDDEEVFNNNIRDFLLYNSEDYNVVNAVRIFVDKLIEQDTVTYKRPLWIGLSQVKDNNTFMIFVRMLLEAMWV